MEMQRADLVPKRPIMRRAVGSLRQSCLDPALFGNPFRSRPKATIYNCAMGRFVSHVSTPPYSKRLKLGRRHILNVPTILM